MNPYDANPYGPHYDGSYDTDEEAQDAFDNAEGYSHWPPGTTDPRVHENGMVELARRQLPQPQALLPTPPEPHWSHGMTWEPAVHGVPRPEVDQVTWNQAQFKHLPQIANEFNHQTNYWCPVCEQDCAQSPSKPNLFHCDCCKEKTK